MPHLTRTRTLTLIGSILLATSAAAQDSWKASIAVSPVTLQAHGAEYASSSRLRVAWSAPDAEVSRYVLAVSDPRLTRHVPVPPGHTAVEVPELKAGTAYRVSVTACLDAECTRTMRSDDTASAATAGEVWRINGRGRGYGEADRLVQDGNVGAHAFKFGPEAGAALEGRVQLYYNPFQRDEKGAKVGEQISDRSGTLEDAASFRGVSGYGLRALCTPTCDGNAGIATRLALFQAVPLGGEMGRVRLFFEAEGDDRRTRIMWLDSRDGYAGRDFHRGASTRCETFADYAAGGGCEPTLAIGVDLDGERGHPAVRNARQFKIAYPTRDSWLWDMAPGTFMFFTTEWNDGRCSTYGFNAAYAVWDGLRWAVQDDGRGCPKLLKGAQAPAPVHLGGARYKVYFNRHRQPGGVVDPRVAAKPVQMLYADGELTADAATVEFEDWEPIEQGREVHFIWADGSALTEDEESRLDDYVVLAPTADPTRLIMYSNMSATGTTALPFIGSAVLMNP